MPLQDPFKEVLQPLAYPTLCYKIETDQNCGDNREPDEKTDRALDKSDEEKDTEYRCND